MSFIESHELILVCTFNVLVGPSGLEPPTSCLSGTRSNHLSYEPLFSSFQIWVRPSMAPHLPCVGGDDGIRTHDPLLAGQVLSQLSYTPIFKAFSHFFIKKIPQNWTTNQKTSVLNRFWRMSSCVWHSRFSIERRWSSRTFRYGYLVTT